MDGRGGARAHLEALTEATGAMTVAAMQDMSFGFGIGGAEVRVTLATRECEAGRPTQRLTGTDQQHVLPRRDCCTGTAELGPSKRIRAQIFAVMG